VTAKKRLEAREASLLALSRIADEGAYVNLALAQVLPEVADRRDRSLAAEITYGVTAHRSTLDWMISKVTGRQVDKLDRPLPDILRIGLYQLYYLDRVPPAAAVHSTVELVKKSRKRALAPFVNGVLRGALRNSPSLQEFLRKNKEAVTSETASLALAYAHPEWLVQRWLGRFGPVQTEGLLAANNRQAPVTLRTNTLKVSRKDLLEELAKSGLTAEASRITQEGVTVAQGGRLTGLDIYRHGWFQIQGESAMLVSRIMDPRPDERVLDGCSAPGGKTTHLAQLMENKGEITALDIYPHRLELVLANCRRLGVEIIRLQCLDIREIALASSGTFDRILLDVPCSGCGVIRRKPDLKWRRQEQDLTNLAAVQRDMLLAASNVLRPGGVLVYSTCTNEPEETEEVIASFLEGNPAFCAEDIRSFLPEAWRETTGPAGVQLYPHIHCVDGFFICRIRRSD
jgi:16S rRNA (cytosine967-C5)-methyltransferase